jgi:hypothetical protein
MNGNFGDPDYLKFIEIEKEALTKSSVLIKM